MPLEIVETNLQEKYLGNGATNGNKNYTLEDHLENVPASIRGIFERLRKRILNLDASVKEEVKKQYIAYKNTTNFVDIELQKKRLKITLNLPFDEINDLKSLCKDITGIGHFGNGDVEISLSSFESIDDVMALVHQSFEKHWEDSDA